MSNLQFALFFVAVILGYALMHMRVARLDQHLRQLAGLESIDERLKSIDDRVASLGDDAGKSGLSQVSSQLQQLHEDLADVREATESLREHSTIAAPASGQRDSVGSTWDFSGQHQPPATRIVAVIETRLLQLGYRDLRLLGDLSGVEFTDEIEVQIEGRRNGMPCKGRVVMRNGSVSDVAMQAVTQSFP